MFFEQMYLLLWDGNVFATMNQYSWGLVFFNYFSSTTYQHYFIEFYQGGCDK